MADGGMMFLWIFGLLVLGVVGFVLVSFAALARLGKAVISAIRGFRRGRRPISLPPADVDERVCRNPRCGHHNPAGARYCARCGDSLGVVTSVDNYG